jgi:SAM-dependent methyltransferase
LRDRAVGFVRRPLGLDCRKSIYSRGPPRTCHFGDSTFDQVVAQLVVHFMADPDTGIGEMARVTRSDGIVSACVWDHAGGLGPLSTFWQAVHDLDPAARGESDLPGARDRHLVELFTRAGLHDVEQTTLTVQAALSDFDQW